MGVRVICVNEIITIFLRSLGESRICRQGQRILRLHFTHCFSCNICNIGNIAQIFKVNSFFNISSKIKSRFLLQCFQNWQYCSNIKSIFFLQYLHHCSNIQRNKKNICMNSFFYKKICVVSIYRSQYIIIYISK